ncbi:MAG: hypothetical protein PHD57_13310, partial [Desulfobacterales bacterium]|nr:hypothetical protein [Desulfobacterales bacterium]
MSANDKSVWIELPSGTLRIKTVQRIAEDKAAFEVAHKRKRKPYEALVGKYQDSKVEIHADLGDKYTLVHELEHFAEDIGLLTNGEIFAINRALREEGKEANAENRADWVEEHLYSREMDRKTRKGRIIQKIEDFIGSLVNLFKKTTGGVLRAFESGKLFGRHGKKGAGSQVPLFSMAGSRAKGADTGLLAQAKSMKEHGKSREEVWEDTGWWEIVPGQWSFEIEDSEIRFDAQKLKRLATGGIEAVDTLQSLVKHKQLFKDYPFLRGILTTVKVDFDLNENSGVFKSRQDRKSEGLFDKEPELKVKAKSIKDVKTVLVHEIQHAIQEHEGFAGGGNPDALDARDVLPDDKKLDEFTRRMDDLSWDGHAWNSPEMEAILNERDQYVETVLKDKFGENYGFNWYRSLTGEAESRLVQKRLDMTAEQKKAEPPWITLEKMLKEEGLLKEGQKPEDILISRYDEGVTSFYVDESYNPRKTVTAYKLFQTRRKSPGKLFPLFIDKNTATPAGVWIVAEYIPTKGYAPRPGWHAGHLPIAPHLRQTKTGAKNPNRVWVEVEMPADVNWQTEADKSSTKDIRDHIPEDGHYKFKTSKMQGGAWMIGGALRIKRVMSDADVEQVLSKAGYSQDEIRKEQGGMGRERMPLFQTADANAAGRRIADKFNEQYPGFDVRYDGVQDMSPLNKPDLYQFTIYGEGSTRGATFLSKTLSVEGVKERVDDMVRKRMPQYSVRVVRSEDPKVNAKADALLKKLLAVFPKGVPDAKKTLRALNRYEDLAQTLRDDKKDIYEKQKALEEHVKAELSLEDRGRALPLIKNISRPVTAAGREKMLQRAIDRVNEIHEKVDKSKGIKAIRKLLKPRKRGHKKGVASHEGLSIEAQGIIKEIREVVKMSDEEAAAEIEALMRAMDQDYSAPLSERQEDVIDETETARRLAVLQTFSGLEAKSASDVE